MRRAARARPVAWLLLAALAGPTCPLRGAPAAPAQAQRKAPVFQAALALVRVTVTVRDRHGALVRGLKREDFTLTEDGTPQTIDTFAVEDLPTERAPEAVPAGGGEPAAAPEAAPPPTPRAPAAPALDATPDRSGRRLVVLLFDANGMEPEQLARAVASARGYVTQRMTASDDVAVASIGSGLQVVQDFTPDRAVLGRALDRVAGTDAPDATADAGSDVASDADAFAPDTGELDLFDIDRRLRAIEDLARALAPVVQKKSVIYFSAGLSGAGADNQVELRAAVDRAVKANLAVYPVDVRGLEVVVPGGDARQASGGGTDVFSGRATNRQFERQVATQDTLAALAADTGGRVSFDTNDLSGVYERVVEDSASYYVLGYTSGNSAKDGKFRRLKIRVGRPDLEVEHRSGYYAESDFRHSGRQDRERQLEDQLLADLPATDFPVWVHAAHFRTEPGRFYVALSVAVPASALPAAPATAKAREQGLDVIGIVRDEAKRAVARLRDTVSVNAGEAARKSLQYRTAFTLPPGRYTLKVVVRENEAGAFGSFESPLEVPELRQDAVKVSSVLFGTQLGPAVRAAVASPLARDGTELVPSVTHVVSAAQPLYFYYEVYDPAREKGGGVRVLGNLVFLRGTARRYETPLVEVTTLAAGDRKAAVFQLSVPKGSLAPGLYTCQVNVIDDVAGAFTFPRLALLVRP